MHLKKQNNTHTKKQKKSKTKTVITSEEDECKNYHRCLCREYPA